MAEKRPHPWHWITELLQTSARRPEERRIGIEVERIGIWPDGTALHYRSRQLPSGETRVGAGEVLKRMEGEPGWAVIKNDQGYPLGFTTPLGKVSLEPGSQVELSTNPAVDLDALVENVRQFDRVLCGITDSWGLKWIGLGVNPTESVTDMDVIPSTRYHIMTEYLGRRGKLGTSMMRLTTSVQINLDYTSEEEAIDMLRASLAVTPVSYALFANSPIHHGKESGYLSYRRVIWRDTDPDRTGLLHIAFDEGFNLSKYAEQIWRQPLMFAQNARKAYVAANGHSLEQLGQHRIPDVTADETNQFNAIREYFTEARLKPGYVEVRSVDGLRAEDRYASTAFWTGLLYSPESRRMALELTGKVSADEREQATLDAARVGLKAKIGGRPVKDVAAALAEAAKHGLQARGHGEEKYLEPVFRTLGEGINPAERVLQQFQGPWKRQIPPLIEYSAD